MKGLDKRMFVPHRQIFDSIYGEMEDALKNKGNEQID